jgi:RNA polymerase sigma-70 factor (ECF subfamily)
MNHTEVRDLVHRARAGDEAAFRRLVELHHERVYCVARAVVLDPADAADVAQEAWIKAWRGLAGFRGESGFGTWLTRLALNAAVDHLRRRQARAALARALAGRPLVPRSALDAVDEREELQRALAGLAAAQRRLVALRHVLDLKVDEIALLLGVPAGTVKSRLHAAARALQAALVAGHTPGPEEDGLHPDAGAQPNAPPSRRPRIHSGGTAHSLPHSARASSAEPRPPGKARTGQARSGGPPQPHPRRGTDHACLERALRRACPRTEATCPAGRPWAMARRLSRPALVSALPRAPALGAVLRWAPSAREHGVAARRPSEPWTRHSAR